ncbi:MAG: TetR/AcrR family transcriptional regulator [Actinophytocola sp.]|uniref:TetR/AcrR family transcriptional regulator n=1 Tax=Actinophytocola sp. TaxID=1872138 RepID=UPI003C789483
MKDDAPAARDVANALLREARHELAEHGAGGVSLRAVARRAGVSHAAPKHHFGDRAGLLTAVAVDGFERLTGALLRADTGDTDAIDRIAALGSAYLDFGIANPAVFELMFNPNEVHGDDPALVAARSESFGVLASAVDSAVDPADQVRADRPADEVSLISWALVHGLVVLIHGGALQTITGTDAPSAVAHTLTEVFSAMLRANPPNRGFGT